MEQQKSRIEQYRERLFELQRNAVIFESDGQLSEEQINVRCAELQKQIIDAESMNNRFRNPALHRIWNSPPRIKKFY